MLHALQPHMFTASQYSNNEKRKRQTEYSPVEADSLFWCLFIIKYGKTEYDSIPAHRRKNREMDEKGRIIDFLSTKAEAKAGAEKEKEKKGSRVRPLKRQEMISILSAEHSSCSLIPAICSYYDIPLANTVIRGAGTHIVRYSVAAESVIYITTK